jgi:hypothetical protein
MDPVYDIESHFQVLPLQLSQQIILHHWQQGDEVFTHTLQKNKDDLVPCFPDDFQLSTIPVIPVFQLSLGSLPIVC